MHDHDEHAHGDPHHDHNHHGAGQLHRHDHRHDAELAKQGFGPNHPEHARHLHSHPHAGERAEELRTLTAAFVEGFHAATDKTSYLRLAGIPFSRRGADGLTMHLVEAAFVANWQLGTAGPAFGSRELAYLPFPGGLVTSRETMRFTYVSLTERADIELGAFVAERV